MDSIVKLTIDVLVTNEDIDDIMCSALEGGICYWCDEAVVVGDYLGEYAHEQISRGGILKLYDREEEEWYILNREKFISGIEQYLAEFGTDCIGYLNENWRIDCGLVDGEAADSIIQYALFNSIVYG